MILVYFLALAAQTVPVVPLPPQAMPAPAVPSDWSALPLLPFIRPPTPTPAMIAFVGNEVATKRCAIPRPVNGRYDLHVDLAVLVGADGMIRRAVPKAINCPTVEQYGAGLVSSFARDNLPPRAGQSATWYRTTIDFDWQG